MKFWFRFWRKDNPIQYKTASDDQLLDMWANNNDKNAYDEICNRYGEIIYNTSANRLKKSGFDFDTANDVVQHCFLVLVEQPNKFKGKVSIKAYFLRIASNFITDHLQPSLNVLSLDYEKERGLDVMNDDDVENLVIWREYKDLLDICIEEFDTSTREILRAYFDLHCKRKELCVAFNLTPKQADNIIYTSQETLKAKILGKLKERSKEKVE